MLRLKESALTQVGARYHYRGVPFSGVMYRAESGNVFRTIAMTDGVSSMEQGSATVGDAPLLDCTGKLYDEDGEPLRIHHGGKPYDGFGCEFNGDRCIFEFECASGYIVATRRWNMAGALLRLSEDKQHHQSYEWNANGVLLRGAVRVPNFFIATVGFSQDGRGRLLSLNLYDAVWKGLSQIEGAARHFPIRNPEMLRSYVADNLLHLSGNQITDAVFGYLKQGMIEGGTQQLYLMETALSPAALESVISMPTLRRLRVNAANAGQRSAVERVRSARPDLEIFLE